MYIDKLLELCTSQDLGGSEGTSTILGESSVDLGAAKNVAKGRQLYVVVTVEEAFVGGTSVDFQVITDSAAAMTTSVAIGSSSGAIVTANLTLSREPIVIPIGNALSENSDQYLGIQFGVVGTFTAGIVSAHIGFESV